MNDSALRCDHLNLVVRDLPAQTAFYRDLLGCRVLLERELAGDWVDALLGQVGARMQCVILDPPGGGARIELLAYQQPPALESPAQGAPQTLGLRHLAFAVTDLEAAWQRLSAAGVRFLSAPVTVPFTVGGRRKRLVYAHDPEGVLFELCEYTAVEESATMQQLSVPDMMCGSCAAKIETALTAVAGVQSVRCDVPAKQVTVEGSAPREALLAAVAAAGFKPR
ncbi:MAG: cation transporter [Fimbriimonadaceae bacterium]|nr:cation transporter [Fimbriimonadaceae bacterium]